MYIIDAGVSTRDFPRHPSGPVSFIDAQGGPLTFHPLPLSRLTNHLLLLTAALGPAVRFQDLFLAFSSGASRLAFRTPAFASYGVASRPRPRKRLLADPLAREDLRRLIADALHCEPERVAPLVQLVTDSTWQDREGEQSN